MIKSLIQAVQTCIMNIYNCKGSTLICNGFDIATCLNDVVFTKLFKDLFWVKNHQLYFHIMELQRHVQVGLFEHV